MEHKMTFYIGILDGSGDVWGVRIPDCPGAYGAGESAELAVASAIKGLTAWAGAAVKDGAQLPNARSLAEILASGEIEAGETTVLVPLLLDSGRTIRVNTTFDAGLLDAIDAAADQRGLTRSAFLASAAREKIEAQR
jgi:predicted RNase H-like HicB family nuclease